MPRTPKHHPDLTAAENGLYKELHILGTDERSSDSEVIERVLDRCPYLCSCRKVIAAAPANATPSQLAEAASAAIARAVASIAVEVDRDIAMAALCITPEFQGLTVTERMPKLLPRISPDIWAKRRPVALKAVVKYLAPVPAKAAARPSATTGGFYIPTTYWDACSELRLRATEIKGISFAALFAGRFDFEVRLAQSDPEAYWLDREEPRKSLFYSYWNLCWHAQQLRFLRPDADAPLPADVDMRVTDALSIIDRMRLAIADDHATPVLPATPIPEPVHKGWVQVGNTSGQLYRRWSEWFDINAYSSRDSTNLSGIERLILDSRAVTRLLLGFDSYGATAESIFTESLAYTYKVSDAWNGPGQRSLLDSASAFLEQMAQRLSRLEASTVSR